MLTWIKTTHLSVSHVAGTNTSRRTWHVAHINGVMSYHTHECAHAEGVASHCVSLCLTVSHCVGVSLCRYATARTRSRPPLSSSALLSAPQGVAQ